MKIIDESQARALVLGFKRKHSNRADREMVKIGINYGHLLKPTKKTMRRVIEHCARLQRIVGLPFVPAEPRDGTLRGYNIAVVDNQFRVVYFEFKRGRFACKYTGIRITDHAVIRYLMRERTDDVATAVTTMGMDLLLLCKLIDDHSQKVDLPIKPHQELEFTTRSEGMMFIEVAETIHNASVMFANMFVKTYVNKSQVDARNGVRLAVFEAPLVYAD